MFYVLSEKIKSVCLNAGTLIKLEPVSTNCLTISAYCDGYKPSIIPQEMSIIMESAKLLSIEGTLWERKCFHCPIKQRVIYADEHKLESIVYSNDLRLKIVSKNWSPLLFGKENTWVPES